MTDRTAYIAGLRQIADLLEAHDDFPLPSDGSSRFSTFTWFPRGGHDAVRAAAQGFARHIPGDIAKAPSHDDGYLLLTGKVEGVYVRMFASREAVCVRRVVGTTIVEVPAQVAREATEATTVTRDLVEWDCTSILAPESVSA